MKTAQTRVVDINPQNRIRTITKTASGGLLVEQHSGQTFEISRDDPMFQEFAMYSVLAEL